jgi:hypothetical protein
MWLYLREDDALDNAGNRLGHDGRHAVRVVLELQDLRDLRHLSLAIIVIIAL